MTVVEKRGGLRPADTKMPSDGQLREVALGCTTPVQMARLFDVPEQRVAELLRDRLGIQVSKGAAHGYTYTAHDVEVYDGAAKEQLYTLVRDEFGLERLAQSVGRLNWYETSGGQAFEALAGLLDISAEHASYLRKPIKRIDNVMAQIGLVGSIIVMCFTFFIVFPPYLIAKHSLANWRGAKKDRPTGAIVIGWILVVLYPPTLIVLIGVLIWHFAKKMWGQHAASDGQPEALTAVQ